MGFFDFIFGSHKPPEQELQELASRTARQSPHRTGGVRGLLGLGAPERQFQGGVRGVLRSQRSEQQTKFDYETRQLLQQEFPKQDREYDYYLKNSLRIPTLEAEVSKYKQANSPYAHQAEQQLMYAKRAYDQHWAERRHAREKYMHDRQYGFRLQQSDYESQTYEQAYKQLDEARKQVQKQQAINQAMYTQSNARARGGTALGQGQRFSRFAPPQAKGTYGRKGPYSRTPFSRGGK